MTTLDKDVYVVMSNDDNGQPQVETRRTDRKTAEDDVAILKWLGKKAWIAE